ncbi:hypothetical protein MKEN_01283800 [Mycena kentingensis (nom. inval.)]|nr:hypothetical protein MKEN_01283800 [Mycena kentingensis (nom. inval.)]
MNATAAPRIGYHGPPTSTLDWCEENYQFSYYIAEMANSVSNIATVGIAGYGAYLSTKERRGRCIGLGDLLLPDLSDPPRFMLGYLGICLVGLGSFYFHATLLYHAQLADELPMIYVTTLAIWLLFDQDPGFHLFKTARSRMLCALTVSFNVLFTWTYYLNRNPIYHQVVFAALLLTIAFRIYYLLAWSKVGKRVPAEKRREVATMFGSGVVQFVSAFVIWNLDTIFCDTITEWKVALGWPTAFLLEGHSWWHILTATGTYMKFVGLQYLALCLKDDPQHFALGSKYGLPYIKRLSKKVD